ncbi:MAG: response regulator [Treponema sp.]|nr:response regulator [Treponema sp.]
MKKVLIIDSHQLFRDFLKQKLADDQLEVILSQENRDSYTKLINILPNLVILDMNEDHEEEMEFLEKKITDANTASIPVIVTGPDMSKASIASLAKYGVIRYFPKPIQFDIFFEAIGKKLQIPLSIDMTPCVLDIHRNNNIVFIELALGMNREKIALLQYKLTEMIEQEQMDSPKVIIMLTNLSLSFVDGYNLEFLIDNVLACPKVHNKNVKILSLSSFVLDLIEGHKTYDGIEVSDNLHKLLNSLMDTSFSTDVFDVLADRILMPSGEFEIDTSSVETRFYSDNGKENSASKSDGTVVHIALIDSDLQSLAYEKTSFEAMGAKCTAFNSGNKFLTDYESGTFDLVLLDILVSDGSGFSVLQQMKNRYDAPPVVVYSQSPQKEFMVKVLTAGARNYLIKPLKPAQLVNKCLSVLKAEF